MIHVLAPLAVAGPRGEMTCSFSGIAMPTVAAPSSCFVQSPLYVDLARIPANSLLSDVNRDSTGGSRLTGPRLCCSGKRLATAFRTQGPIPGPPSDGFRYIVRSCEGEVRVPRHERALLRLANPVGGVRPGHKAHQLWVHRAMMLRKISPI